MKKNAALLRFLAFLLLDLLVGVPRGRAPWAGVRCLGTAGLFSLPFLVTKKEGLSEESLYKRVPRRGGGIGACMGTLGCTRKATIPQSALSHSQLPLHKGASLYTHYFGPGGVNVGREKNPLRKMQHSCIF